MKSIIEKDLSLMCSVHSVEGKLISVVRVKHNYRKLSAHEIKKGEVVYFAKRSVVDMKKYTSPRL